MTPKRGRPPGRTDQGEATKQAIYEAAIRLFDVNGFEATTLRDIASEADVSPGLLYRYFPSKVAVVLELYEVLSVQFEEGCDEMPLGSWLPRFQFTLRHSLAVLGPHRRTLAAVLPVLLGDAENGLLSPATAVSRDRVMGQFVRAVAQADDRSNDPEPLGRLLYLMHLGVLLWWLLDRSEGQRVTGRLVALIAASAPMVATALWLPGVPQVIVQLDAMFREGLLGESLG